MKRKAVRMEQKEKAKKKKVKNKKMIRIQRIRRKRILKESLILQKNRKTRKKLIFARYCSKAIPA